MSKRLTGLLVGVMLAGLLGLSCGLFAATIELRSLPFRRLWADLTWAINDVTSARFRKVPQSKVIDDPTWPYRVILVERTQALGIKPHQFWRSFRPFVFSNHRGDYALGQYDDAGRALLLARLFRWTGAVFPYLIFWLAPLACMPVLAWCIAELWAADRPLAASVFGALVVGSPFVTEALMMPRNALGFYIVACLLFVALLAYAALRSRVTPVGAAWRFALAGAAFAVCIACRSSSIFLLAVAALALPALLVFRRQLKAPAALLLAVLLVLPSFLGKPEKHHDAWITLWEGLGDFDRTKGHTWSDVVADEVVRRDGAPGIWTPESQRVLRRLTLDNIAGDPLWYAGILVKRALVTVTQWKLWPYGPLGGVHMRIRTSDNEGGIDKYYGYTTTADHVGFGRWNREIPIQIGLALGVTFLALPWLRRGGRSEERAAWEREALAVGILALGCLGVPVAISTAGGQETQAFVFVYFFAAAFLAERLRRVKAAPAREPATPA